MNLYLLVIIYLLQTGYLFSFLFLRICVSLRVQVNIPYMLFMYIVYMLNAVTVCFLPTDWEKRRGFILHIIFATSFMHIKLLYDKIIFERP